MSGTSEGIGKVPPELNRTMWKMMEGGHQ